MSISTPGGACSTVSLRTLLREAVFVGAEDIRARRCVHKVEQCRVGDVFVPMQGSSSDGHDDVEEAVRRGVAAVVAERLLPPLSLRPSARIGGEKLSRSQSPFGVPDNHNQDSVRDQA